MTVVTRFPPSPTGYLHIGGARTALYNWLYARRHGGKFVLRIEDTDRERSTEDAVRAIFEGLKWMGLNWDNEEVVFQFSRRGEHARVANHLLAEGKAYKCFATQQELEELRARQKAAGLPMKYDGRWRDRDPAEAPAGTPFVIRLKAPQSGETTVKDHVRGDVTVQNTQLDDMVLLRSDGTPTYMLSVVVDDNDMDITHIIRGDDHFTNTFRQVQLYNAMGWNIPEFAHLPLIHGPDGQKLSKRHGALGVEEYRDMGYLPEAMRNYLLRLGWSHGDDEIIPTAKAIEWFNLDHIVSSPARFDMVKLDSVNAHYMREMPDDQLVELVLPRLKDLTPTPAQKAMLVKAMPGLKQRAKTLVDLAESTAFYIRQRPLTLNDGARKILKPDAVAALAEMKPMLAALPNFIAADIEHAVRNYATGKSIKLGDAAQPLRAALSGSNVSPPVFEVAELLGREETLGRIDDVINPTQQEARHAG
jgi:glutamyl-tRNA synthetase